MSLRLSLTWTYLATGLNFVIAFGSAVVVARLVSPRDFGIFGMAIAITTVINVFMSFGLAKYIMREEKADRDLLRSLFTVNAALTAVYIAAILLGAACAFKVSDSPEVGRFLLVFCLFPAIGMFEFIPSALNARNARFGLISAISILRAVVLTATTIGLAVLGYAYMSFAWGTVIASFATTVASNAVCWRPDVWKPRLAGFRTILRFGADMVGISGFNQLSARFGEMALGSLLGLATLGLYTRASSLPTQLYANIYGAGSNVIFSRLSREVRETGSFHESYGRFMRLILGLLWPAMTGCAVLAQPLVHLLYGAKWQEAALPLALLMLAAAVTLAIGMSAEVFVLRHETRRQLKIESFRSVAGFLLFVGGAMISLPVAAAAKLVEAVVAFVLYRQPMDRLVAGPAGQLNSVYLESLLLSAAATFPSLILMAWSDWSPTTPIALVLAAVLAGSLCWAAFLIWKRHPIASEAIRAGRLIRTKQPRAVL
jgi:O-antigen/teichoic acid export membrane protein